MHTHSDYVTALSCLKDPHILPIHQSSMRFVERVAYYQQYDVPDVIDEGKKLGEALEDKDILIMGQHGTLSTFSNDTTRYKAKENSIINDEK